MEDWEQEVELDYGEDDLNDFACNEGEEYHEFYEEPILELQQETQLENGHNDDSKDINDQQNDSSQASPKAVDPPQETSNPVKREEKKKIPSPEEVKKQLAAKIQKGENKINQGVGVGRGRGIASEQQRGLKGRFGQDSQRFRNGGYGRGNVPFNRPPFGPTGRGPPFVNPGFGLMRPEQMMDFSGPYFGPPPRFPGRPDPSFHTSQFGAFGNEVQRPQFVRDDLVIRDGEFLVQSIEVPIYAAMLVV
eukprot:TRINITY_DN6142_c0_g1_i9.p1 TRINITY_DN6142_c0_g1~~TRINITY_DN6142_c0_g1_i9.p1  ORF type:complete len:248 (+),score=58.49 TRINITY_DN6142_c0_g1_i9:156-899(+)